LHEHWNYFTKESLAGALRQAGFSDVACHCTPRGTLYGWGRWEGRPAPSRGTGSDEALALRYLELYDRAVDRLGGWLADSRRRNERIGLYGASVGASYLRSLLDWRPLEARIFDSDAAKHGRYLPGWDCPIGDPRDLQADPPDRLLIVPVLFAQAIEDFFEKGTASRRPGAHRHLGPHAFGALTFRDPAGFPASCRSDWPRRHFFRPLP
jgi:hypothetical protein